MSSIGPIELPALRLDLDLFEKVVVAGFLGFMAARLVPGALQTGAYLNILLLISESIVVVFVLLRRRATTISRRGFDWLLGFAGTLVPLLAAPAQGEPVAPIVVCVALLTGGMCVNLWAKLTLRRSFGVVAANRGVKSSGPYGLVRHPMYAGYMLTHLGFFLSGPNAWNACVYGVLLCIQVGRILAEERVLSQDPTYRELSAKVRYRLLPGVF